MPELFRTRDCVVLRKGKTTVVTITPEMAASGWHGGQGVAWASSPHDEFLVGVSDGDGDGFCLWGSDEVPDEFTSMTRNQPAYRFVVIGFTGWIVMTTTYEVYTYASRMGPGPLVPIMYGANDPLYFSLRGYWTSEQEWTLSGDPRAPNEKTGFVAQVPTAARDNFMTVQVIL